jgi:hypothetical protein
MAPGPTIEEIRVGDEPDAWRAAGFAVDDDGVCRAGTVRIRLVGRDGGKYVRSWSLRGVEGGVDGNGDIDGLPTEPPAGVEPADPAVHPNGTLLIDHLVVATPDLDRTIGVLERRGLTLRRTRETATYGAPMRQAFFRLGEVILEVIGPGEPAGDGPARFFGFAFTVDDLDATHAGLGDHVGRIKDAVQEGRRITTLRHKELDISTAIAFMSPEP